MSCRIVHITLAARSGQLELAGELDRKICPAGGATGGGADGTWPKEDRHERSGAYCFRARAAGASREATASGDPAPGDAAAESAPLPKTPPATNPRPTHT